MSQLVKGVSSTGLEKFIQVDSDGKIVLSSLPSSTNNIGQVLNGYLDIPILPSLARTTSGNSVEFDVSKYKEASVFLDVTAASGTTPTLDAKFQTQDPVSLKWFDVTELTFSQKNAVSSEMKTKANLLGSKIRCTYTIGGTTPSFTFSVGLVLKS